MVRPSIRSGKRKLYKTISGKYIWRSIRKKANAHKCAECKKPLPGMPRGSRVEIRRLSKTQRRPERPYGGQLCSPCTRRKFKLMARQ